jgi:hypothetical protein
MKPEYFTAFIQQSMMHGYIYKKKKKKKKKKKRKLYIKFNIFLKYYNALEGIYYMM